MSIEVTEEMIDRVMPDHDDIYPSCPLCDYTGHWNCTMGDEDGQRQAIRYFLEKALASEPDSRLEGIKIDISETDVWICLDVAGDIRKSYPIFGDEESRNKHIDIFAEDLKRALSGERISTLG